MWVNNMFWNKKSEYEELYDKIDKLQKELKNTQDSILKIVNIMKNYDFNKRITYESGVEEYMQLLCLLYFNFY